MEPKVYIDTDHEIDPAMVDRDAVTVIEKLHNAGHQAYLVGGGVRDLLCGVAPKDFDISTSAKPEEIKRVFGRQCILIGRRFRLAHIRFGRKIIEVATFRAGTDGDDLIVEDNIWGTPEEDVMRRDFTINGLFYDPFEQSVIDYVGGWEHIHKRLLVVIGDPAVRFRQDPVRMIRLLKFRARFGFEIDDAAKRALVDCRHEITKSSPARLLEEMLRMLESGSAARFFHLMTASRMLDLVFPELTHFLRGEHGDEVYRYLVLADQLNSQRNRPLERPVLISCLLFPILELELKREFLDKGEAPHLGEVMVETTSTTKKYVCSAFTHFPRRISSSVNYILADQYRLTPLGSKKHGPSKLFKTREFKMVLDFLKIRAMADRSLAETFEMWDRRYHQFIQDGEHRKHHHHHPPPHRRRRRRRGPPS